MSTRGDRFAQVVGFLVFIMGLAIIVGVLWAGFDLWRSPTLGVSGPGTVKSPDVTSIGLGFGRLLVRILLLFLGSICGSLIANKGVRLYFAGTAGGTGSPDRPARDVEAAKPEKP